MENNYNIMKISEEEKERLYKYFKAFDDYDFDDNLEKEIVEFFDSEINYCRRKLEKPTIWRDFLTSKLNKLEELRYRLQFRIDYINLCKK